MADAEQKLVSIIIPFHSESRDQLEIVLSSINIQIGVDFNQIEVILVSDGGTELDEGNLFPELKNLDIQYYRYQESKGAGFARQVGMEMASGRYYMFIDADDELHFVGALLEYFNVIKYHGDHQIIIGKYLEQSHNTDGEKRYFTHQNNDWKSVMAKWFNAGYINMVGIQWKDDLRIFEDTYFVGLACELATDIYHLDTITYMWMDNPKSTVRKDNRAFKHQAHDWARSNRYYFEVIRKQHPVTLVGDFTEYMADLYYRNLIYKPADQKAFEEEQTKLLIENRDLFTANEAVILALAKTFSEGKYAKIPFDGFNAYMEEQRNLLATKQPTAKN